MKNRLILYCKGRLRNEGWRGLVGHHHPPLGQDSDPQHSSSVQLKGSVAGSSAATALCSLGATFQQGLERREGWWGGRGGWFDVGGEKGGLVSSSSHSSEQHQHREHSPRAELPTFHWARDRKFSL